MNKHSFNTDTKVNKEQSRYLRECASFRVFTLPSSGLIHKLSSFIALEFFLLSFLAKFSDCRGNVLKKNPANLMPQTCVVFTSPWGNILYREQMVENFNGATKKPCFSPCYLCSGFNICSRFHVIYKNGVRLISGWKNCFSWFRV